MKEMLHITGIFDRLSGGNSSEETNQQEENTIEDYEELLKEYKDAEAEIRINIATLYFERENFKESIKNLEKAIEIYTEMKDLEKQALVFDLMGDINRFNKKNNSALKHYREAYRIYSEINSDHKIEIQEKIDKIQVNMTARVAETIYDGISPKRTQNNNVSSQKSPDYSKISSNIEEVIGMLKGADTYLSYAKSENPMEALESAYDMSSGIGDDAAKSTLLLIMGYVNLEKSKTEDSLKYFNEAFENFQEIDDKIGVAVSSLLIGTAYYIIGNIDMVNSNFRKSIAIFRELKDVFGENVAMRLMNAIYEE